MNKTGIPILMYHGIVSQENSLVNAIHISKRNFEEQMTWLSANNYRTIGIREMLQYFQHKEIPSNCIVLTFDDGYESLLANATPILENFGFKATLFLLTGAVGKQSYAEFNTEKAAFPENDRPLNWKELKIMQDWCWDVQSHSCNHYTYKIRDGVLENELRSSKEEIEFHLQKKVEFYSYPYGSYSAKSMELIKTTGYQAAFSVHPGVAGWNSDIRRLPRIEINRFTDLSCFQKKVETGYSGRLNKLTSSIQHAIYRNTKFKDVIKTIYDRKR